MSDISDAPSPANAVRWTEARIRNALLHPKPRHREPKDRRALAILLGEELPVTRPMNRTERSALEQLAARADIVSAAGRDWLIVPATPDLVDALAAIGAEREDLEADVDAEPDHDGEFTVLEWEPRRGFSAGAETEDEREVTRHETIDQTTPAAPLASDDHEDEFGQRVRAWASLNVLTPGFAMADDLKYARPWRTALQHKARSAKAAANGVRPVQQRAAPASGERTS